MPKLSLTLLGGFTAALDGEPITAFDSNKVRTLLAYLAMESDRAHRRESLAALLWPDYPESSARTNLRNALSNLRTAIGDREADPPFLIISHATLQFNTDSDYGLDVAELERAWQDRDGANIEQLSAAADLYCDDFLAGFSLDDAVDFDDWAAATRERLRRHALDLLGVLSDRLAAAGDREEALIYARRRVALEPWQEEAQRQLVWLLAEAGQRSAALRQYQACVAVLEQELGVEPSAPTQALYEELLAEEPLAKAEGPRVRIPHAVGPCPYRGLAAFREIDAPVFFGRETFVERLVGTLGRRPAITAVVGPSGSGKSSVVAAGLLPRLREMDGWLVATCRPGREPFQALAGALMPHLEPEMSETSRLIERRHLAEVLGEGAIALHDVIARIRDKAGGRSRVLTVIDQFEELYTLCPDPEVRHRFIDALLDGTQSAVTERTQQASLALLLTLRADFMGQALGYRPFADTLQTAVQLLGPMTREELRAAIEKPAAAQGAVFEPGLVARLLDDVGEEPGSLPLLEFALTLLWERLDAGWLTHAAYEAIGRVAGALAQYAEEEFEALDAADQALARRIFVQLVQPGEGTEDTRRVATRRELGNQAWDLIQHLADRRLVVTGRDEIAGAETVEVVHEALIQHWDRLQAWMAEDRAFRTWQERLRISVRTWEATERDEGALLRGAPLVEAENWLATRAQDLSQTERIFVEGSVALRERRAAEREAQLERERAAARQLAEAHEQALHQAAVGLAAEARNQMQGPNQDVAVLLALEAVEHYPYTWQAERALGEIVRDYRLVMAFSHAPQSFEVPAFSPDGTRALTAAADCVFNLWDVQTGDKVLSVAACEPIGGSALVAHLSPSGDRVLTTSHEGVPKIWGAETGALLLELSGHGGLRAEWSPDGTRILSYASRAEDAATVWCAETGRVIHTLPGDRGVVEFASFSPDGAWIAASGGQIWNAESGELSHELRGYEGAITRDSQLVITWAPAGTAVGAGIGNTSRVWDVETGDEKLLLNTDYHGRTVLWWSPQGDRILTVSIDEIEPPILWDARTGRRLRELPHAAELTWRTDPWSPAGDRIVLPDDEGRVTIWDASTGQELLELAVHEIVNEVGWIADGQGFATTDSLGNARIWRVSTAQLDVGCRPHCSLDAFSRNLHGFARRPAWSPDGNMVARQFAYGGVVIWDVTTGVEKRRIQQADRGFMNSIAWSPDGASILTLTSPDFGSEGEIEIWDVVTGESRARFAQGCGGWEARWSPDGERILTYGFGAPAVVWNVKTGEAVAQNAEHDPWSGDWSPDGTCIVTGDYLSGARPVRLWDAQSGQTIRTLLPDDFAYGAGAVAWSPDGSRIVTFSGDQLGRIWDAETGKQMTSFAAPTIDGYGTEWSPRGSRFLLSTQSGLRVWDAETTHEIMVYPTSSLAWGSWSPDGTHIAIATWNGDLKVYPAWESLDDLIAYAKEHCVLRDLTPEERTRFGLPPVAQPPEP